MTIKATEIFLAVLISAVIVLVAGILITRNPLPIVAGVVGGIVLIALALGVALLVVRLGERK